LYLEQVPTKVDEPPASSITMSTPGASRFVSQNKTTTERLSTNTVGLVALSDFRKRRAEVIEQQEREAREAILGNAGSTPDRSQTATPNIASDSSEVEKIPRKKQKKRAKALVSFGDEEEEEEEDGGDDTTGPSVKKKVEGRRPTEEQSFGGDAKVTVNSSVGLAPRALTKAALRREAAERDALRKEFLAMQTAVKSTEIAIPFVFYDGANIPGGTVRVKKGDFIWVFLDKSRKVGAELGVGGEKNAKARREWARVSVDDLMLVRGSIIIPPASIILHSKQKLKGSS
jgi:protein FAM50